MPNEYKIRFPDGKFSTGGMWVRHDKKGKTWKSLAHLKNHLRIAQAGVYGNAHVVRYEVIVLEKEDTPVRALLHALQEAEQKKQTAAQKRVADAVEARERAQLASLQLKYSQEP